MEAIVAGEWINGMCSSEEAEFMAELLGNCSLPNESTHFMVSPSFNAEAAMYSEETSMCSFSQGTSFSSCTLFPFSSQEGYYSALSHHVSGTNADNLTTMDYCKNGFGDDSVDVMGGDDFLNRDVSNDSTQSDDNERGLLLVVPRNEMVTSSPSESKKRSRVPCDVPRSKKSTKCAKMDNDNNSNNNALAIQSQRQTSSNYCSEDESNEMNYNTSCSTSKGKRAANPTRASRGSATDPQSLYARKRRERINERLKVLQTLVPNGTKVDISTMLEEAVEYVKFLQLQIKLLSSDDLWMYSPIAYNGMDIGLDLRISTAAAQQSS